MMPNCKDVTTDWREKGPEGSSDGGTGEKILQRSGDGSQRCRHKREKEIISPSKDNIAKKTAFSFTQIKTCRRSVALYCLNCR